jgi:PTH1 family peptidyl-tRNA hydrolase
MYTKKHRNISENRTFFDRNFCKTMIVGLGNPGYEWTRHNAGSDLLQLIIQQLPTKTIDKNLFITFFQGFCSFVYLSPDLMNISGNKIAIAYKKFHCEELIIVVDDLDTKIGEIKQSFGVSSGGHNGVKSIINNIGHNRFHKIKIGIGRPSETEVSDYVLQKFSQEEKDIIISLKEKLLIMIENIFKSLNIGGGI